MRMALFTTTRFTKCLEGGILHVHLDYPSRPGLRAVDPSN